jgi:serine/threonine-protein kinase HipA
MQRTATVHIYNGIEVGSLWEDENGYTFQYKESYMTNSNGYAISKTLPLTNKAYQSKTLFPFFDGLIPEGWLMNLAEKNWKLNEKDRFGMLLACCKDCIGAVSIIANNSET